MKKVYKKLTEEQKARGVIFSSTLSTHRTELEGDAIHEVTNDTVNRWGVIELLMDDKFFNNSPWNYNVIRR